MTDPLPDSFLEKTTYWTRFGLEAYRSKNAGEAARNAEENVVTDDVKLVAEEEGVEKEICLFDKSSMLKQKPGIMSFRNRSIAIANSITLFTANPRYR